MEKKKVGQDFCYIHIDVAKGIDIVIDMRDGVESDVIDFLNVSRIRQHIAESIKTLLGKDGLNVRYVEIT